MPKASAHKKWFADERPWWMRLSSRIWAGMRIFFYAAHLHFRKKNSDTRIAGLRVNTRLEVFHPKFSARMIALIRWLEKQDLTGKRMLDAGTGTGVVALVAALRGANVMAIDRDPQAVQLACENARLHKVDDAVHCCEVDNLRDLQWQQKFDCIIGNPGLWASGYSIAHFFESASDLLADGGTIALALDDNMPLSHIDDAIEKSGLVFARRTRKTLPTGYLHFILLQKQHSPIPVAHN